jgi:hypothetical protein
LPDVKEESCINAFALLSHAEREREREREREKEREREREREIHSSSQSVNGQSNSDAVGLVLKNTAALNNPLHASINMQCICRYEMDGLLSRAQSMSI